MSALQESTTEGLLRAFAALTHRMHDVEPRTRSADEDVADAAVSTVTSLRAQRNLIRDEVLRRTGDL